MSTRARATPGATAAAVPARPAPAGDATVAAAEGGPPTADDLLFFKLVRVVNLTARPFQQRVGRQHQLKLNEWRVMHVLGANPGFNATQVVEQTGLDKMSVSRALAGLKRARRLQAHGDPTDQRRSRLYLTAAGKELFGTASEQAHRREAELFSGLDAAERAGLGATLDKLIATVSRGDDA